MKKIKKSILFTLLTVLISQLSFTQEGVVTIDQDNDIEKLLEFKKDIRTVDIYKIEIYKGRRVNAENEKTKFLNSFGQWSIKMVYETPNYKIWVGNFTSRLEADKALIKIKKKYMNAFIFKPKKNRKNP